MALQKTERAEAMQSMQAIRRGNVARNELNQLQAAATSMQALHRGILARGNTKAAEETD